MLGRRYNDSRARTAEHLGPPTIPGGRVIYLRRLKAGSDPVRYDAVWLSAEVSLAHVLACTCTGLART